MTDQALLEQINILVHEAAERGTDLNLSADQVVVVAEALEHVLNLPSSTNAKSLGEILLLTDVIGSWSHRTDITDSVEWSEQLRRREEQRPDED